MDISIFDVGHGFCSALFADNGNVMLVDCGANEETGFRPSRFLPAVGCGEVQMLVVSNYDEDHMRDLPGLLSTPGLRVRYLSRNRSLDARQLLYMKAEAPPIGDGALAMARMMQTYTADVPPWQMPIFPNMRWRTFCNSFPVFTDENNLSVVTFAHYGCIHIVFPGDLERAGWLRLLRLPEFRAELAQVNVFVASHHGREDGYCKEVFDFCKPEIIIVSDGDKVFDTQETVARYAQHASGVRFTDGRTRYVLTTRQDGTIWIRQRPTDVLGWVWLLGRN